jgi:hypothetical protein
MINSDLNNRLLPESFSDNYVNPIPRPVPLQNRARFCSTLTSRIVQSTAEPKASQELHTATCFAAAMVVSQIRCKNVFASSLRWVRKSEIANC